MTTLITNKENNHTYNLLEKIGSGGNATVFRAEKVNTNLS